VPVGRGKVNQHTVASVTFTEAAKAVGVNPETAKKRVQAARKKKALLPACKKLAKKAAEGGRKKGGKTGGKGRPKSDSSIE